MNAEIITIGDELLIGQVLDTNSGWISERLIRAGIPVVRVTTISDEVDEIVKAFDEACGRSKYVLTTGGLGPTKDDATKSAAIGYFGGELILHEDILNKLERLFEERGLPFVEANREQAYYPDGCTIIPNLFGSAQGMFFEKDDTGFFIMPGVPFEMEGMMESWVLPYFRRQEPERIIGYRVIGTTGIIESALAERVEHLQDELTDVSIAYLPSFSGVRMRITTVGEDRGEVEDRLSITVGLIRDSVGNHVYTEYGKPIEEVVGKILTDRGLTLATAESCTGGLLGDKITSVAGSSDYYKGGVVVYSNELKESLLGVQRSTLTAHGAVSEEIAIEMAEGVREKLGADIGISTTGIAGPGGGTQEKPVGLVFIGYADGAQTKTRRHQFGGGRDVNKERSAYAALGLLWKNLS